MRGNRRVPSVVADYGAALVIAAVLVTAVAPVAASAATVSTTAGLDVATAAAFTPPVANISNRPAMLLETDYYVYGPGTGFTVPEVTLSIANVNYDQPSTLYVYWQNRVSGQELYYNIGAGFSAAERDLFGATAGAPAKIFVPTLTDFRLWGPNSAFGAVPGSIPTATGQYQFVVEVRDANGNGVVSRANAMYNVVDGVVSVNGNIAGGNWSASNAYFLTTPVYVTGGTLNVEPGTVILGSQAGQGTLIVLPDGQIQAPGTAMRPIVFTSELTVGDRGPGDWGGLVLSGDAPVNGSPREGEGDSGQFGGNDPSHNCGTLQYVRVEFAGIRFSEQNELNGIALQGCGTQTVIDHVQVHFNSDDGIEFFGGTNDAKYVAITFAQDDSLDWTFGWVGRLQHFVAIQGGGEADHGIEADSDGDNPDLEPRSNPTIYNATWVGPEGLPTQAGAPGFLLRRGTQVTIRNAIVQNFIGPNYDVDGAESQALAGTSLTIGNSFFFSNAGPGNIDLNTIGPGNSTANPLLANPRGLTPDVSPRPGSPARTGGTVPPNDGFFDQVGYAGGVDPNNPWIWEGWLTFSDN
jgi:hypothetical protein